ncbi:MAG: hypothetical protein AAGC95_01840 [Pseudomonadota bacterium]
MSSCLKNLGASAVECRVRARAVRRRLLRRVFLKPFQAKCTVGRPEMRKNKDLKRLPDSIEEETL